MRTHFPWRAFATIAAAACSGPTELIPTGLRFATEPGNTTAGAALTVTVNVVDESGALVTSATNPVTLVLSANPGNATLAGTKTVSAVNGVATFSPLSLNRSGTGYALTASSTGLTPVTSSSFDVTAGAGALLAFVDGPAGQVTSGLVINPAITVAVKDLLGNTVTTATQSISLAIAENPGSATLSGTLVAAAVNGIATFAAVSMDKAGIGYVLRATASGLAAATSGSFSVIAGPSVALEFSIQPPGLTPTDTPLLPAAVVRLRDANGNLVTAGSNIVTIALGANPGNAFLGGTTSVTAVNGAATFSTLRLDNPGTGYTLVASSPSHTSATSSPFTIRATLNFTAVSAGYFHSCGIGPGSQAYCWGENLGKLGDGTEASRAFPVAVLNGIAFATISAGRNHSCGLTAAGAAYCWGVNGSGELGDGTTTKRLAPVAVAGGLTFSSLTAGYAHTCGLTPAGSAWCWGGNGSGELGDGTTTPRLAPVRVSGSLSFRSVSPGRFFTCGVSTSNQGYCWGYGGDGELGNTVTGSTIPVAVAGGLTFSTVGAGGFDACALSTVGQAYCWGSGWGSTPVLVSGGVVFTSLSVGNRHTCGLTAAGTAYCWGDNSNANLGDGTLINRAAPTLVAGALTFARISAGRFHSCGATTDNAAYCWGGNFAGQVGFGPAEQVLVPVRVR